MPNSQRATRNPQLATRNPQPATRNAQPATRNPQRLCPLLRVLSSAPVSASPLLKAWLVVVVIAIGVQLGGFPLLDADEGRNAEVAREMAATNDYVMPRLDGLPYLDKPIVYFAAEAAFMEILGPTELAARLPAYLFTLATAAVLFFFARRAWGSEVDRRRPGAQPARTPAVHASNTPWIAAIVFLSMPLTIAFARTVIFDSALTFFVVVALAAFYFAVEENKRRWSVLAWGSMGLAMITKGPVTFVLVLFVVIPYAWKRKNVRVVFPLLGVVVFAAVIAPWVWGVSRVVPEFLNYVLVTETAARVRASSQIQATIRASGAMSGRMYWGRFDCEIEKKTKGTAMARSRYSTAGSRRFHHSRTLKSATSDQGSAPARRYGMKYHGGPVRLSAFVAILAAVSVTST